MKIERHSQIIRLISQYDIETQEELAEKLNESGFQVTQATVSRENIPMCCVLRSSPWIWHRIFWW